MEKWRYNEIKEILDKLKDDDWYDELDLTGDKWIELKQTETKQVLDYITNLQQENERLRYHIQNIPYRKAIRQRDRYKSRCEKAIEILHSLNDTLPLDIILSEIEHTENLLQNNL